MAKAISEAVQKAATKYADTLQEIKDEFAKRCQADKEISSLLTRIQSGSGSYEDASEASRRLGSELSKIYTQKMRDAYDINISANSGQIDDILRQTLKHDYDTITELSKATQESLNKTAGINMKAVVPEYNVNRTEGIISRVDEFSQRNLDAAMNELETNMVNYSMSVVDDSVKANADYQFKAGMVPKVKRIMHGFKPCKWCQALAGTYEYPDVPDDVYRRHQNCYCTVTYTPSGSKTSQDVWSKKWGKEQDFEKDQRKRAVAAEEKKIVEQEKINQQKRKIENALIGKSVNGVKITGIKEHLAQRSIERNISPEDMANAIEKPLNDEYTIKYNKRNEPSFNVIGEKATLAVNPDSGFVITVHGSHSKLVNQLKGKKK